MELSFGSSISFTYLYTIIKKQQTMESRVLAMKWWNDLTADDKGSVSHQYFDRDWFSLTGREIEKIHKHEVTGELFDYVVVDENNQWLSIGKSETEQQFNSTMNECKDLSGGAKIYAFKAKKLEEIVA